MAGLVFGQNGVHRLEHFGHAVGREDAADTEAVDRLFGTISGGFCAEVEEGAALDDGIQVLFH